MSIGTKIDYWVALSRAHQVVSRLEHVCTRIEIAGSIRRKKDMIGDIEIVFVPRFGADMFGTPHQTADLVWQECESLVLQGVFGKPVRAGDRYRQYPMVIAGIGTINVDLFAVLPPATWGAILAIRTGPADYSQMLVKSLHRKAWRCHEGRVIDALGKTRITDTEEQFFEACGVPWIPPEKRK